MDGAGLGRGWHRCASLGIHVVVPSGKLNSRLLSLGRGGPLRRLCGSGSVRALAEWSRRGGVARVAPRARPAGTGTAHAFRAGADGLTLFAYGTREPNDICYYPRSRKVFLRGVDLIARLEHVDYWDGED